VLDQHLEQRELARGQRGGGAGASQFASAEVDHRVAEADFRFGLAGRSRRRRHHPAAQHGVDARHQFARIERLGQVVVGAQFQTDDAVDLVALGGQHDDGEIPAFLVLRAQAAANRQAVLARHHQVEHDEVVEFARQRPLEQLAQPDVVVDHQDLGGLGLRGVLVHEAQC